MSITLVHNNSSMLQRKMLREWLTGRPDIRVLDWPSKGCDMNPIDYLWAVMDHDQQLGGTRNTEAIKRRVTELWDSVRQQPGLCCCLVNSIPRHLKEVIMAQGGWSSHEYKDLFYVNAIFTT